MSITLPTTPGLRSFTPRLISARSEIRPAFGGGVQRISRTGSRWAANCTLPPMTTATAMDWSDLLHETDTCILNVPEPGLVVGAPGAPLVNGASQAGSTLVTDGWTAGYTIPKDKWFSVSVSGLLYLYKTTAAVVATTGAASLPIRPMLRASPADNAVINVNPAKIEGYVSVGDGALEITVNRLIEGLSFVIEERR